MKQSIFVLAVLLLNLASIGLASDNTSSKQPGGWLQDEQESTFSYQYTPVIDEPSINSPTLETVWEHGQTRVQIRWDGLEGNLVKGSLLKNGTSVDNVLDWHENSESAVISEVLSSWGSGSGFQIRLEDNLGNFLLSDEFRIMAPINITEPSYGTTWAHSQTGVPIRWSGAPGSMVTIELLESGNRIATLAENIPNTGEFSYDQPVSQAWRSGDSYSIRIRDNIGNVYQSRDFSINAIYITYPNNDTEWSDHNETLNVAWEGGSRVVRVSLFNGSQHVKDLSGWIDNTGSFIADNLLSCNIEAGDSYRVHIQDDQDGNGFSPAFSICYSINSLQGALQTSGNRIEETISAYESMYFLKNLPSGHYRISIESDGPVEVCLLRSDGSEIARISSSNDDLYVSNYTKYIMIHNSSNIDNNYSIIFNRLNLTNYISNRIYIEYIPSFIGFWEKEFRGTTRGAGLGYSYSISNSFTGDIGLSYAYYIADEEDEEIETRMRLFELTPLISWSPSNAFINGFLGIGYSINSFSLESTNPNFESDGDYDYSVANDNNFSIAAGIRFDFINRDNSNDHSSMRLMLQYCPSSEILKIRIGALGISSQSSRMQD